MIYRFCFNVKQETTPQINPFRMIFHHSTVANPKNPQKHQELHHFKKSDFAHPLWGGFSRSRTSSRPSTSQPARPPVNWQSSMEPMRRIKGAQCLKARIMGLWGHGVMGKNACYPVDVSGERHSRLYGNVWKLLGLRKFRRSCRSSHQTGGWNPHLGRTTDKKPLNWCVS